ncbi:MAG: hypothetical protein GXY79_11430, partial [Chloroflexi bacterium]|nr:hypothetical protein [Chloroflexota bacterium]
MDAGRFLRQELVIDLHNDTIVAHQRLGNASLAQPGLHYGDDRNGSVAGPYGHLRPATGGERLQLDLVRMAEAGL